MASEWPASRAWRAATPEAITTSPRNPLSRAGNERTSVGVSFFLYWRFSARTRASDTMATVIAPRARAGATDCSHAARPGTRTPAGLTRSTSKGRPEGRPRRSLLSILAERVVRFHDLLHELVPHDVPFVEVHEADPVDVADDVERLDEARHPPARQIDLRDVAGDDRLRTKPEARQEHLHLLAGRVLRLVEDDERVVERPAAHEGDRRDFDGAALDQACRLLGVHHVEERVVERPQIRVDLFRDVTGQEPELFARFDRRPREADAADLFLQQVRHRLRHRQVGLARAGRPHAKDDVVLID